MSIYYTNESGFNPMSPLQMPQGMIDREYIFGNCCETYSFSIPYETKGYKLIFYNINLNSTEIRRYTHTIDEIYYPSISELNWSNKSIISYYPFYNDSTIDMVYEPPYLYRCIKYNTSEINNYFEEKEKKEGLINFLKTKMTKVEYGVDSRGAFFKYYDIRHIKSPLLQQWG